MKSLRFIYISAALILVFSIYSELTKPRMFSWEPSFEVDDKNPFGLYIFKELSKDLFKKYKVDVYYKTLYDFKRENLNNKNLAIKSNDTKNFVLISKDISFSKDDVDDIVDILAAGNNVFISALEVNGLYSKLGLKTNFANKRYVEKFRKDTNFKVLRYFNESKTEAMYHLPFGDSYYFDCDSVNIPIDVYAAYENFPVIISTKHFGGNLILSSVPYMYVNVSLLDPKLRKFAEKSISMLPDRKTIILNYWSSGISPIRYILSNSSLSMAYYVLISSVLFFMVFGIKRRQRFIPLKNQNKNTSVEFISTIAKLGFSIRDNKDAAVKKINHFYNFITSKFNISIRAENEDFHNYLSSKSGIDKANIKEIFEDIKYVNSVNKLNDNKLFDLCRKIDDFYKRINHEQKK